MDENANISSGRDGGTDVLPDSSNFTFHFILK